MPALELPDPAIHPANSRENQDRASHVLRDSQKDRKSTVLPSPALSLGHEPRGAAEAHSSKTSYRISSATTPPQRFQPKRTLSLPGKGFHTPRPTFMRRMFSAANAQNPENDGFQSAPYHELDARQEAFFTFLDSELDKIESFYKTKEYEATKRLHLLRDQLHEMRDRRMYELAAAQSQQDDDVSPGSRKEDTQGFPSSNSILKPIENLLGKRSNFGKTTKAMNALGSPVTPAIDGNRDYTRRFDPDQNVSHRSAKRKLKVALQELYKAVELLKSYALLNRTAFRKINKKYDKAVNARPKGRYMSEKVNKAYFVQSEIPESHIVAIEDLYARYFERGNHKIAVGKLRSKLPKAGDYSGSTFRNGLFLATGLVFGIEGLSSAANQLSHPDQLIANRTSYLLQVYAGYFLSLLLWRMNRTYELHALFITCALINSIYTSIWDVAMDWSLGNPYAPYRFLRPTLAFRRPWVYYLAMVIDPILRFQWVFYVIFADDLQHSALLSFLIALAEVGRRGLWSIFRVENEHCTNVGRFRASRDVPLPYSSPLSPVLEETQETAQTSPTAVAQTPSGVDLEQAPSATPSSLRYRHSRPSPRPDGTPLLRGLQRMGSLIQTAHAQDFQRKKRPGVVDNDGGEDDVGGKEESSDEEEQGMADQEVEDAAEEVRERLEEGAVERDSNGVVRPTHSSTIGSSHQHRH
ncbi:MAG: hypothetical protein Q9227_001879 [Pyrenula ochraceoflavens]